MQTPVQESDADAVLTAALRDYWGYSAFRPLQRDAMKAILAQRDALVVMPTGGGKSLCYQAPAVCLPGTAVIVSPLISLMKDQVDAARANGISATALNSSQSALERRTTQQELRDAAVKLLYVSPERLVQESFLELLSEIPVSLFAIDEAHCVSHWGHDFRPQYRELRIIRERFPRVGVHAFTATATEQVRDDIAVQLGLRDPQRFVGSFDRPNLTYRVLRKSDALAQVRDALQRHEGESGILYCITRKEVEQWSALLATLGHRARPYHAGLPDEARHSAQEAFLNEEIDIIVATVAFGMGIDKSNVRFVIHTGMPKSIEHYQQESGRAGRDGLEAECVLLFGGDDFRKWQFIFDRQPEDVRAASLRSLQLMTSFCEGALCRHRALVRHFGQDLDEDCGGACDICSGDRETVAEPLVIAQKILSSVYRQQQRFGAEYTAQVLLGARAQRILDNGHDRLSTYGLLQEYDKRAILDWIGQLVQQGFLRKAGEFGVLQITADGGRLLKGLATPRLLLPADSRKRPGEKSRSGRKINSESWKGVDRPLFEVLRKTRLQLARERMVPPYQIFSDATLRDLARRRPTCAEGLLEVYGIGAKKAADFGELLQQLIEQHCAEQGLRTDLS